MFTAQPACCCTATAFCEPCRTRIEAAWAARAELGDAQAVVRVMGPVDAIDAAGITVARVRFAFGARSPSVRPLVGTRVLAVKRDGALADLEVLGDE
jgi:hypothetical protein